MRASAGLYRPVRVRYWMRPAARPAPPLLCTVRAKCVVAMGHLLCAPEGVGAFLWEKRLLHSQPAGTAGATPSGGWAQPGTDEQAGPALSRSRASRRATGAGASTRGVSRAKSPARV